jgi:hypothetical protein
MKPKAAPKPDYSIKHVGDQFKVFDKEGRFRVPFGSQVAAEQWITGQREATHRHPFAPTGSRI